ncbi:hypothetical protein [Salmonirosea aquatica]|uniref:Uncharacterized protein n=1 Tax=Salmonirosea aquatica TaxID=2654236 RepID=A0A7C9BDM3_9BACT|nr:hypothetical protein [Cytophagaceae bacterium SJW1-29]
MAVSQSSSRLSNLQLELLKLYPYNVSDNEVRDIKKLLANYFANKIDSEMDQLWDEKAWDAQTIEGWKKEHLRSRIDS